MVPKKLNIEFIRIFAVLMTIVIHVSNNYIRGFEEISRSSFLISVILNSFSRICVPLFFMIGGIFAIPKEYSGKKYLARIIKFIIILVLWSVIYFLTRNGFAIKEMPKAFINSIFNADETSRHLWYMYPLIGIYIALPFIQNMCKNLKYQHENLFLGLWLCFSGLSFIFLPAARAILKTDIELSYPIPFINSAYYLGYFISGHILYKRFGNVGFSKSKNIICILVYILASVITTILAYFISVKNNDFFDAALWYRGILIIIASFAIFILIAANEQKFKAEIICKLSKHTFGIYLVHIVFLDIIKKYINILTLSPIIAIPLITALLYICSLVTCIILSKIPFIKKIVF